MRKTAATRTPQRVQLSRRKGWRLPEGTIVVARPTRWGNPYVLGKRQRHIDGTWHVIADRAIAVRLHREWLEAELARQPAMLEPLRGHSLACWCPLDGPCHVDTLLELANR
ncbi:MAG TPA: DUF4326 domain-containing protein [Nevskiaceae bacterium]|nr:DUF4326 domain-containing protein [Nevskiaceae bacterium]